MNRMVIRRVWKAAMRVHVARRCLSTQQSAGASSKGTSWTKVAAVSERQESKHGVDDLRPLTERLCTCAIMLPREVLVLLRLHALC